MEIMEQVLLWVWVALLCCTKTARAWNSHFSIGQLYSFQDFYTDAQYGPDFGYYSTGRILHVDGPSDVGAGGQEWFNSYTTLPMSLSPYFGHALCDRLAAMWAAMGGPKPFVVTEFGGGTGMLARDILRRARDAHSDFYASLTRYFIAERSQAMRAAQNATAREFVSAGKLSVLPADGRLAASLRPSLEAEMGDGAPVVGILLSNELLDEFDPVRLRLVWRLSRPPSERRCRECSSYREAYVAHSIDTKALVNLLEMETADGPDSVEAIWHEGQLAYCGLLSNAALRRVVLTISEDLTAEERWLCAPMLVCCFPFVLAVNSALQYHHEVLYQGEVEHRDENGERDLVKQYRALLRMTNETVPLTKARYRQLRRIAAKRGPEAEKALLVGDSSDSGNSEVLGSGRLRSLEIFLALTRRRCRELAGWRQRHAGRLAHAARLRDVSAPAYGMAGPGHTTAHLKLVLRPGEAEFARETAKLLDEGFLVTLDYGADADALLWFAAIRPHYEGIHIMDARAEFLDVCTVVSHLECPGLQDLTTSVDFTEVAMAGAECGWTQKAYGPIWLLELGSDHGGLGHLLERAGGLRSPSLQAWYLTPEQDPWASFKILVQHRGQRGGGWSLGPLSQEWPLSPVPRLLLAPSPCWSRDITKPPLASLVTTASHQSLGEKVWRMYSAATEYADQPLQTLHPEAILEDESVVDTLSQHFLAFLMQEELLPLLEQQSEAQQRAYANAHLAALLVDYWHYLEPKGSNFTTWNPVQEQVRDMAASRLLPILYGEKRFEEVFRQLEKHVFTFNGSVALRSAEASPPYLCLALKAFHG